MILLTSYINKHSNKILILLFSVFFLVGILSFKDYGISIDEEFQRFSGFYWLNYVVQFMPFENLKEIVSNKFDDINGFTLPNPKNYPAYGVIFDLPAAYLEVIFNLEKTENIFYLRHFLNFLIFYISSIFFYKLLIVRFSNFNVSILGTLLYVLSPRIYGNSFYNNKDLIFLSLTTIAIYFCFKSLKNLTFKNLIFFSFFSALATSLRILGIFLPVSFSLIYIFYILDGKINLNIFYKIIFYLSLYSIFLLILWPYLWALPIDNFIHALALFAKYNNEMKMLFMGNYINSTLLPASYLPIWISSTTPALYLIFFFLGFVYMSKRLFLRFLNIQNISVRSELWRSNNEKLDLFIFFNFTIIFLYLLFSDVNLYTGWRQVYFINIFLIYISTYFIYIFLLYLKKSKFKFYFNSFMILYICCLIIKLIIYHPYQSFYFNSFVSNKYKNNIEIDYWGISGVKFLDNILKTDKAQIINIGVASYLPLERSLVLLNNEQKKRLKLVGQNYQMADYIFNTNISEVDKNINTKYNIPKNFIKISEFKIENSLVYEIYKKNKK